MTFPDIEFFTAVGSNSSEESVTPAEDTTIEVYYDCEGVMGAAAIGTVVTELNDGASYLIYNAKNETTRSGFLSVGAVGEGITATNDISEANPGFIWNLEGSGKRFTVRNNYGIYIPRLLRGSLVTGGETAETFIFNLNSDGKSWNIKGTSNNYYWNGNANNTFTGWDDGHPFIIYSYKPHPYFLVQYRCIDEDGNELAYGEKYVKGGDIFTLFTPIIEGYRLKTSDAVTEELLYVSKNTTITLVYTNNTTGIEEVKTENRNVKGGIYDLTGRKVETPTRGIYIIDGKQVLIK